MVDDPPDSDESAPDAPSMWRAVLYAIVQQMIVLFISGNVLDGGDLFRLCIVATMLSWIPVAVIGCERLLSPRLEANTIEIVIVRYGFWVFFIGMCLLYYCQLLPSRWYFVNRVLESHPSLMKGHRG
jgi:hypothetical protein